MPRFSHSQLQLFKQCQLRYRFQYIDKMPTTFDQTVYTLLGTSVHSALEFLYKQVSGYQTPSIEAVIQVMKETWHTEKAWLVEPVLSETEDQFLHRWESYIEWYYRTYTPFNQARPWGFEQNISYRLDDDTTISWVIDRLDAKGDTLYINDYKTNQKLNADDHDTHEEQLTIYGLAAQQSYGKKFSKIIWRLIYLHLEKEYEIDLTHARMETIKDQITTVISEIKHKAAMYNGWLGDSHAFSYTTGDHCKYCPFEMVCPAWKHKYQQDEMVVTELGEASIKRMIDEYGMLQKKIKALEDQKKWLWAILEQYIVSKDETRFFGNEYMLSTRNYEKIVYSDPVETLHTIKDLDVLINYAKPNDSTILKDYKAGTLPQKIRSFIRIDTKKILFGTRPLSSSTDEEEGG